MPSSEDKGPRRSSVGIGRDYEQRAAQFYLDQHFEIIEKNYRVGRREIDLIARRGDLIVFVEVKSSRTGSFGHPAERIDDRKVERLTEAARSYLAERELRQVDVRFDVVTFSRGQLEHFPNAFEASEE